MNVPEAVFDAVAQAAPGVVIYDGIVPETPPDRYIVIYAGNGTRQRLTVCDRADGGRWSWQVTSVAPTAAMARWLSATVQEYHMTHPISASGWVPAPVEQDYGQPFPMRDEVLMERPVVYTVDQYSTYSATD